jgi:hypothetical protein
VNSISDWIAQDREHGDIEDDREIAIAKPEPGVCQSLRRVVSRAEVGENVFYIYTSYYCSMKA